MSIFDMGKNHQPEEFIPIEQPETRGVEFDIELVTGGFARIGEAAREVGSAFEGLRQGITEFQRRALENIDGMLRPVMPPHTQAILDSMEASQRFQLLMSMRHSGEVTDFDLALRGIKRIKPGRRPKPYPRDRCFLAALELSMRMHGV